MSGRLLSLTSIETASASSDSTSPLTNPKISLSPSMSRGRLFPRSPSRSGSENCTPGVLAHRLLSNPFQVRCEEPADVLYLTVHHVEPVYSETPSQHRNLDPEGQSYLGPEYATPAELHPTNAFTVGL